MKKIFFILQRVEECKYLFDRLPQNIQKHCSELYKDNKLTTSLFAYSLLDELLNKFDRSINEVYFSNNGKPLIENGYISISHSDNYVSVSYSKINHGIDIEIKNKNRDIDRVFRKYFKDSYLENDSKSEKEEKFYSLWVEKEANVKLNDLNVLSTNNNVSNFKYLNIFNKDETDIYLCIVNDEECEYIRL